MRGFGDFWAHMLVAEGAADAAVDAGLAIWDWAPMKISSRRPAAATTAPSRGTAGSTSAGCADRLVDPVAAEDVELGREQVARRRAGP